MFGVINKLLYKITFKLFDIEGINILFVYDTRDEVLKLNDVFHLFDDEYKSSSKKEKEVFINKIKNKEVNIPFIDNDFIKILSNIEGIRQKIIELIKLNDFSQLKLYILYHNLLLNQINNDDFDILIYAIENDNSIDMIESIISFYNSLNYSINNKRKESITLDRVIENSIDILTNNNNSILTRLLYLNKILNEYESEYENYYYTPLYCAISNNKFSIAKILLKNGANINYKLNNRDIICSIVDNKKWNKLNMMFILQNKSYINFHDFITFVTELIKENNCNNECLNIILQYYTKNVTLILKLLSIYKNNIKVSKNQLHTLLLSKNSNIPIEWLFQAIDNDNLDIILTLINNGININEKSIYGDSPLFRALKINSMKRYEDDKCINTNNVKIILTLIKNNANVNEVLSNGDSLLVYAIKRNNTIIVKELISSGAYTYEQKCNEKSDSILVTAIKSDREELIEYIIKDIQNNHNEKILQDSNLINLSINYCSESITDLLIESGTKIDSKVCLANALYMDYKDTTIKYLIEHGADINKEGDCNKTPLIIAIEKRNEDLIKYLIENGANDDNYHQLVVYSAVANYISNSTIQYIIGHNIGLNNDDLSKSLVNAINKNDESLVKILVDSGANVNYRINTWNYFPLNWAFEKRNENIIKYLIEHGASVNEDMFGIRPLTAALQNFNESFIKFIIDKGADLNYTDDKNKTPLFYAVRDRSEVIIKYLIDRGAKNCSDVLLRHAIYRKLSEPIIQHLLDHGAIYESFVDAIKCNYSDSIIKKIIDHGSNINKSIELDIHKSLIVASKKKRLNVIQYLLEHNADISKLKRTKERSFVILVKKRNNSIENYIKKQIASSNIKKSNNHKRKRGKDDLSLSSASLSSLSSSLSNIGDKNLSDIVMRYIINKESSSKKRKNDNVIDSTENESNRKKRKNNNIVDIDLNEYLIESIENNSNEILIRSIIDHGANVNNGFPLIKAIENNYSETIIQYLLEHDADVNEKDEKGKTPLTLAIENSNEIVIKMIIDHGADFNLKGEYNRYPINLAIDYFNESIVQYLIDHGAKVRKDTLLVNAISKYYNEELILHLINHGANFPKNDILKIAFKHNYSNIVMKSLIDHHVSDMKYNSFKENSDKDTNLLANLILINNEELVRYIIEHGIYNIYDSINGIHTPLTYAVSRDCSLSLIKYLTERTDNKKLRYSSMYFNKNNLALITYFNERGFNICNYNYISFFDDDIDENIIKYILHQNPDVFCNNHTNRNKIKNIICDNQILIKYFHNHQDLSFYDDELLQIAIEKNDMELIEYFINNGMPVSVNSIILAVKEKNLNLVKKLMDCGVDINKWSRLTCCPLVTAIKYEQLDIIKYFINHGVNLNEKNRKGDTLFEIAIDVGNLEILNYLIYQGIQIKINSDDEKNPLTLAIKTKKIEIVKLLMSNKNINVNMFINLGNQKTSPLITAIQLHDIEMVKYLIEHGADPYQQQSYKNKNNIVINTNSLICAVNNLNMDIIQYLIEWVGVSISKLEKDESILVCPISFSKLDIIKYLIEHNANVNKKDKKGWTPLFYAVSLGDYFTNLEVIKYLVEQGADINAVNNKNETVLLHLIKHSDIDNRKKNAIIKYFVQKGADLNKTDQQGYSILEIAKNRCSNSMINYLINQINPNENTGKKQRITKRKK